MYTDYRNRASRIKRSYPTEPRLNSNINFKDIFNFIIATIIVVVIIDVAGYGLWKVTGQTPQDSFFIGAITNNILN